METTADSVLSAIEQHVIESARASFVLALKQGVPADRLLAAIDRAMQPVVEAVLPEPGIGGYAAPSEGLIALLKAEGGCIWVDEARDLLGGIARQTVNERIKRGSLIAAKAPNGQYAIPKWQINSRGEVYDAVPHVLKALMQSPGYSPLTAFAFFLQPSPLFDLETPLAVMRKGGSNEQLVDAAREFGLS